jgi:hypothetical protein
MWRWPLALSGFFLLISAKFNSSESYYWRSFQQLVFIFSCRPGASLVISRLIRPGTPGSRRFFYFELSSDIYVFCLGLYWFGRSQCRIFYIYILYFNVYIIF